MSQKKVFIKRIVSFVIVSAMTAATCLTGITGMAAGESDYKIKNKTPEDMIGSYGLTALDSIYINAHCHSNFLVKVLNNNANSGLNDTGNYQPYNEYEEFYFYDYDGLNNSQLSNKESLGYLYIGKAVSKTGERSNAVELTNSKGIQREITKPGPSRIIFDADSDMPYADMDSIATLMKAYNQTIRKMSNTNNVVTDFKDQNARTVTCQKGQGVAVMDAGQLAAGKTTIVFQGIEETNQDTSVVFNIDLKGKTEVTFDELVIAYGDREKRLGNSEQNAISSHNRIYYNFFDSSKPDGQYTGAINFGGRGFGTIIAPSANVVLKQNWDGVVIADKITIEAQFHRIVNPIAPPKSEKSETPETPDTPVAKGVFSKQQSAGKELPGASLSLTISSGDLTGVKKTSGAAITVSSDKKTISWTSGNVPTVLEGLPAGVYTWKETAAPDGYEYASDVEFKVDTNGKIYRAIGDGKFSTVALAENEKLVMIDEIKKPKGDLEVTVIDEKTNEKVPNAQVSVKKKGGGEDTKVTKTTDKDGKVEFPELETGDYIVTVEKVPDGYTVTTEKEVTVTVEENKKTKEEIRITIAEEPLPPGTGTSETPTPGTGTQTEASTTESTNERGHLTIVVYDEETGEKVPNATITVTGPDGVSREYTTNSVGEVALAYVLTGDYSIKVDSVPDGYTVKTDKTFNATVVKGETTKKEIKVASAEKDKTSEEKQTGNSSKKTESDSKKTSNAAKTGDNTPIAVNVIVMLTGIAGFVLLQFGRNRQKK